MPLILLVLTLKAYPVLQGQAPFYKAVAVSSAVLEHVRYDTAG
jgi:hypothetical protein